MTQNVLVTSAGRRVSLVRGFAAVCEPLGRRVLCADARPDFSAACRDVDESHFLPLASDPGFPEALAALCVKAQIGLIVPTIDTELGILAELRTSLLAHGTHVVVSDPAFVAECGDKRKTHQLFSRHGLSHTAVYESPERSEYPVFAKPWDGSLSRGIELLPDRASAERALKRSSKLMLCEYKDPAHHDEFTIDCYYDRESTLRCVVPRQRLEVRGGEVSKALAVKNELVDELFGRLGHLAGARGVLTMQAFINRDTRETTYIEINARFGGGYPLTRRAGADYQQLLVDEYLEDKPLPAKVPWNNRTMMLRYDSEVIVNDV